MVAGGPGLRGSSPSRCLRAPGRLFQGAGRVVGAPCACWWPRLTMRSSRTGPVTKAVQRGTPCPEPPDRRGPSRRRARASPSGCGTPARTPATARYPVETRARGSPPLPAILCLAVTGILAGCRSLTAIWEHAADLEPADPGALGLEEGRALPSESTIRRVLQDLDPAGLDARLTSWFFTRTGAIAGRRVIAVEDETMRGARTGDNPAPHLLAAPGRASGVVVGQRRVSDKSNEIPALPELLAPLDLDGAVVTADAMHTQRGTAEWIRSRGAHYVLTVKNNQPGLKRALKKLPWKDVPAVSSVDTGHGRRVRRTVQAIEAPAWIDFPGAAQVIRIRRTRTVRGRKHIEVVHPVLLPSHDRRPARAGRRLGPRPLDHREPPPLGARRRHGRGPPPAAHRQRTPDHGRPAQPRHQPHQTPPRPPSPHRRHHQSHGPTPPTSHRPDHRPPQ